MLQTLKEMLLGNSLARGGGFKASKAGCHMLSQILPMGFGQGISSSLGFFPHL